MEDRTNPLLGNDDYGADPDGDGLLNEDELAAQTDRLNADTDGDGLNDGDEVHTAGSNPLVADTDGGGAPDGIEVHEHRSNPLDPADDYLGQLRGELSGGCSCYGFDGASLLFLVGLLGLRRRRSCA